MTDTLHNEEKEAIEAALNQTAAYRGVQLCLAPTQPYWVSGWQWHVVPKAA